MKFMIIIYSPNAIFAAMSSSPPLNSKGFESGDS